MNSSREYQLIGVATNSHGYLVNSEVVRELRSTNARGPNSGGVDERASGEPDGDCYTSGSNSDYNEDLLELSMDDECNTAVPGAAAPSVQFASFEYHIVYCSSYGVPVLYFRASSLDGAPLSLDRVWSEVPDYISSTADKYSTLTQAEHPELHLPCVVAPFFLVVRQKSPSSAAWD